ncbi:MAG: NADH-quinone oxidoreductase subunit N [Gemmatimonadetes bacterium]|nr:NADH-quinone oxidoreductase subunit N [Gemmatimonadota bacterium]
MLIDYSTQLHYLWALLPEAVLSVWAMVVLLIDVFQKGARSEPSRPLVGWLALAGVALAAAANGWLLTLEEPGPTGMIALDSFRVFSNFLFLLAAALFVLVSMRYLEQEHLRLGELYTLVLLATVGMMVFAGSRDLIVIFLGLELMSVAVYVLTGANRRDRRSAEGALKYFLLGAFSSAFFLFGIALVYGGSGTTNLALVSLLVGVDGLGTNALLQAGVGLLAVGFAFKVAAVPFHMWTPDAYQGAPAPITGFMAAAVKAAAFAAFLRVFLTGFPGLYDTWSTLVFWLALATMVAANLAALAQADVKRMLAYSSIAHAGYLLVALAAANTLGAASFLFYLVVYTLMTVGAFTVLQAVGRRGEERTHLEAYSGLGWEQPLLGMLMTVFLLSLAGFPLTGGFIGKVFILRAAVETGFVPLAVVLVLASLVSYWYYLRVAWYMWFQDAPAGARHAEIEVRGAMRIALVAAAAAILFLGVFPGELLELAERSAAPLLQAPGTVLGLSGP